MTDISKLEITVLEVLYKDFQVTEQRRSWPTAEIFKKLGIKNGVYVGILNNSKFINLVQETFQISDDQMKG